jgi:nitrate reductase gamma subunit
MKALYALVAFGVLLGILWLGAQSSGLHGVLGVALPYAAMAVFIAGVVYRVAFKWGRAPVPFRIPTTCGQQATLPWIKSSRVENPHDTLGVVARMALEVLAFRSLFRNTESQVKEGGRITYDGSWELWAAAIAFHYSFLVIVVRHMRFFLEPVPWAVRALAGLDGFFEIGVPTLFATNVLLVVALGYLLYRRLGMPQVRYVSLAADYFPLFLLLGVAGTGILMRYFGKTDVVAIKQLAVGLVTFHPVVPQGIGPWFFVHIALVSVLLAYFPFSKLMHMPGVFMSPTRNLANNNRRVRHVNPWNHPVKVHTYEEWEDEFREKIRSCGLPLDKA